MRSFLGWVFLLLAAAAIGADLYDGPFAGGELQFATAAERWSAVHTPSLIGLNSFTEKQISPDLWDLVLLPGLTLPAVALCGGLALFFFLVANIRLGRGR